MRYKRSENACSGYKTCDCGGETGAKVCYSGTVQKFDTCKTCCDAKYQYDSSNCTGGKILAGSSCGGKYESCTSPCGSEYIYDETNCPSSKNFHCSASCGDKYRDCKPLQGSPYRADDGVLYVYETDAGLCENKTVTYNGGLSGYLYPCAIAEEACLDLRKKLATEKDVYLTSDVYCGNLNLRTAGNTVTLHGNGHTVTFENIDGLDFGSYGQENFMIENLNIVSMGSELTSGDDVNSCSGNWRHSYVARGVSFKNVHIKTVKSLGAAKFYGTNYVEAILQKGDLHKSDEVYSPSFGLFGGASASEIYGTLNVKNMGIVGSEYIDVKEGGVLNIMNLTDYMNPDVWWGGIKEMELSLQHSSKGTINICTKDLALTRCWNKENVEINYDANLSKKSEECSGVPLSLNQKSGLCSTGVFSESFWK